MIRRLINLFFPYAALRRAQLDAAHWKAETLRWQNLATKRASQHAQAVIQLKQLQSLFPADDHWQTFSTRLSSPNWPDRN